MTAATYHSLLNTVVRRYGDDLLKHGRNLSDGAYRTHVEALMWCEFHGLESLDVEKADLQGFAAAEDVPAAVRELVDKGWWREVGDTWWIGSFHISV